MIVSVRDRTESVDLRLPTHPQGLVVPRDTVPEYIPVAMRRKVFLVNDSMVVGTAGSVYHIQRFIGDLQDEFHDRSDFTYGEVRDYLHDYPHINATCEEVLKNISAILLVEASDRRCSLTIGPRNEFPSKNYGKVIGIGTGSSAVRGQIERLDRDYRYGMSVPSDAKTVFPEFETLARNLTLLASVYWNEFMAPNSVFGGWGGAYDLVYQDASRRFRFLDGYSIFLRMFDVDRADDSILPQNILKYERRSDVSVVTTLLPGRLAFFAARDILSTDEPLTVSVGGSGFTMNSEVHISVITVGRKGRFLAPMIQIDGLDPISQKKQTVFTDFDDEGHLRVFFHAEHEGRLVEQVKDLYEKNRRFFEK